MIYLASAVTWSLAAPWTLLGVAVRIGQEVGAHRSKIYKGQPSLVAELWKRSFWCGQLFETFAWLVTALPGH